MRDTHQERFRPEREEQPGATNGPAMLARQVSPGEALAEAELAHAPDDLPAPPATPWQSRLVTPLTIGLGAILGANARYLLGVWAAARWPGAFPWGTLLINVTGSLVIGFYLTLITERFAGRATTRLFVATGFLGAYTTFSTLSYETVTLVQQGLALTALGYVAASLGLGLLAVIAGSTAAHAL